MLGSDEGELKPQDEDGAATRRVPAGELVVEAVGVGDLVVGALEVAVDGSAAFIGSVVVVPGQAEHLIGG